MPQQRSIRFYAPEDMPEATAVRGFGLSQDFAPHVHARHILGLCEHGQRVIGCGPAHYTVAPDELFLISSGTAHRCLCGKEHAYTVVCLAADLLPSGDGFSPVFQNQKLAAEIRFFQQTLANQAALTERRASLKRIVRMLQKRQTPGAPGAAPNKRDAVQRVRAYIHEHFAEKCSLELFASAAGLSPCHLQRLFCKQIGISPQAYLTRHRVRRAALLLQQGLPQAETAQACGFTDQSHMIRVFKRYCGLSPQSYLRQNQGNGLP